MVFSIVLPLYLITWSKVQGYLVPFSPQGGEKGTPQPVGSVWPRPQTHTQDNLFVSVDVKQLKFVVKDSAKKEIDCPNLKWTIEHYKELIANLTTDPEADSDLSTVEIVIKNPNAAEACSAKYLGETTSEEAYEIEVKGSGKNSQLLIKANETWGALRALETLYQMLWSPNDEYKVYNINATKITDIPRFPHRGLMVDTSRHYQPVHILIQILTIMMYSKFNILHWHMIDDHSFPFVSKRFPELSEKGAFNPKDVYTYEAIAKVQEAAKFRGIRVILEFDTPGHVSSIGKSHQEVLTPCYGDGTNPGTPNYPNHQAYENIDPTRPESYTFIAELFKEIIQNVSQDRYLHLGMDEVYDPCWASSPVIKQFMKDHGFNRLSEVQGFYTKWLVHTVKCLGALPISWQDPLDENVELEKDVVIQVWKNWDDWKERYREILNQGYRVLLSSCWYINYIEYSATWRSYYECDPIGTFNIPENQWSQILGGEAAIWGEYVDQTNIIPRLFPYASAVAAVLWDSNIKDGSGRERTDDAMHRLDTFRCTLLRRGMRAQPISTGHCGPFEADVSTF